MSAARTAASLRSGPSTSIAPVPSPSNLTDERRYPKLRASRERRRAPRKRENVAWPKPSPEDTSPKHMPSARSSFLSLTLAQEIFRQISQRGPRQGGERQRAGDVDGG